MSFLSPKVVNNPRNTNAVYSCLSSNKTPSKNGEKVKLFNHLLNTMSNFSIMIMILIRKFFFVFFLSGYEVKGEQISLVKRVELIDLVLSLRTCLIIKPPGDLY